MLWHAGARLTFGWFGRDFPAGEGADANFVLALTRRRRLISRYLPQQGQAPKELCRLLRWTFELLWIPGCAHYCYLYFRFASPQHPPPLESSRSSSRTHSAADSEFCPSFLLGSVIGVSVTTSFLLSYCFLTCDGSSCAGCAVVIHVSRCVGGAAACVSRYVRTESCTYVPANRGGSTKSQEAAKEAYSRSKQGHVRQGMA